jgi:hypothetical protein
VNSHTGAATAKNSSISPRTNKITSVPVTTTGANFDARTPTELFQAFPRETATATSERFVYDVTRDGQRFLINSQIKSASTPMSVVLHWAPIGN